MKLSSAILDRGYDLPKAARAIRALLRNPDDLPQVFTIIDSMSGRSTERLARRLGKTHDGRALLRDKPRITDRLGNRDELRALPDGSLGRAYLDFVESEAISVEGLLDACAKGMPPRELADDVAFVNERLRDTHDLWHAVMGYQGDIVGEVALLAFTAAQTANPAIATMVFAALAKGLVRGHASTIFGGYRRGRTASWFVAVPWESLLALPLDEVRTRLGVDAPPAYEAVRSADLRESGKLAA